MLLESSNITNICGKKTERSSDWTSLGGPVKGSYVVKNGSDDYYDYVSDFGMYVEDPCQAVDDKLNINLDPRNRIVKDLKYHNGTDSEFWLLNEC